MSVVKTFRKASVERRRLYVNYECWLEEAEILTDLQVLVTPFTADTPLVVNGGYADADQKKLVIYAAGGAVNTDYVMSLVVRTSEGQTKKDDLGLRVTP